MKRDDALAAVLSGLQAPRPSPEARERALHRATIALGRREDAVVPRQSGGVFAVRWALLGAMAILAVLIAGAVLWRMQGAHRTEGSDANSIEADRKVLAQIEALFGPQLNAVIEHPGAAPDIRLSEKADTGNIGQSQPVLIELKRGRDTVRVLGYSGRAVCVELAGHRACFEPLATGDGSVILSGEGFCWTPQDRSAHLSGYQIEARLLSNS